MSGKREFFSTPLDETHLWQATAYIDRNRSCPAGSPCLALPTVQRLELRPHSDLLDSECWQAHYDPNRWRAVLETSVD